jgi:DNA (cytosine-5)-methyltransferase 1
MRFGSVCSGIEAASVAWHPLGWEAAWLAEIEPFPSSVLAHHYPGVPNLGDMTKLAARVLAHEIEAPDVLVGGTPCQAFSVAGLRQSLDDDRGQLTIKFLELADAIDTVRRDRGQPECIIVWENVPGVLSTKDNAFGCFLAGIAGETEPLLPAGERWTDAGCVFGPERAVAWRVLDAQYFGVAQRRRRVFVVASARDRFDSTQILFERDGLRRDTAPSREARKGVAGGVAIGPSGGCLADLNPTLDARAKDGPIRNQLAGAVLQPVGVTIHGTNGTATIASYSDLAQCLRARTPGNLDNSSTTTVLQPVPFRVTFCDANGTRADRPDGGCYVSQPDVSGTLTGAESELRIVQPIAFDAFLSGFCATAENLSPSLGALNPTAVADHSMRVRRLTPTECERLQGFPDSYTAVPHRGKPAADGPRYKALGNSMAVPVMAWIGQRIQLISQHAFCGLTHSSNVIEREQLGEHLPTV